MPQFKSENSIKRIFTIRIVVVEHIKCALRALTLSPFFSFDSLELLKATILLLQLLQMIPFKSTFLLYATRITSKHIFAYSEVRFLHSIRTFYIW